MTWNTGTANDYLDLLDQMLAIMTSRHVASATVNAGGTGYVVGDILTVAGGTFSHVATLRVLTIGGGGAVTSFRVETGGAYTVDPTTTGNALTGGTGASATANLNLDDTGWTVRRRSQEAVSATVGAGGTGYVVGNDITVVGGLLGHGGTAAVFNVDTVGGGGAVTGVSLVTAGNYEELPTNPVAVTGGAGTGATLNVTWAEAVTQNQVVIVEGEGFGATDSIFCGLKTWNGTNSAASATTYNWAVFGMTSYNALLKFHEQSNLSPGLNASTGDISASNNVGAFVPLKTSDAFDITFWISATPRRVCGVAKVETASLTHYMSWHFGFLNQLGTTSEFPYPLYVSGSTNRKTGWYADTSGVVSGLSEMIALTGGTGPGYVWDPNAQWVSVRNATVPTDTSLTVTAGQNDNIVYPAGLGPSAVTQLAVEDRIVDDGNGFTWRTIIFTDGAGATFLFPTPGDQHALVNCVMLRTDITAAPDAFVQMGEPDGLFWTSAADTESPEDEIVTAAFDRYRMFPCGNRNQTYSYFALRED